MSGENPIPTTPIEINAYKDKRKGRDAKGHFLPGQLPPVGCPPAKKGEVRNPMGHQSPAYRAAVSTLNMVGEALHDPRVRERIDRYIREQATGKELIDLSLRITDREDLRGRMQAAGELVGLTLGQLVAAIKANPARDAAELAKVIEADAEVRDIAPP